MSFVLNDHQQMSFLDPYWNITEREKRFLEKSWAIPFSEVLFPAIDERPYAVLYSEKDSRPNTPVNVILGALILKELNGLTDEGILNALLFDIRYQIALHTSSCEEQPLSDRTFSRFRARCLHYQMESGIDLIHNTMCQLADKIAEIMHTDRTLLRMDSVMVASNIRKLSRLELIYRTAQKELRNVTDSENIPDTLRHFSNPGDYNEIFYHENAKEEKILSDAREAFEYLKQNKQDTTLLERVLSEQTECKNGNIVLADPSRTNSHILQSPYDEDATFRKKLYSKHVGYVGNILEASKGTTSVILDYAYHENTYSDSRFLKDTIFSFGYQKVSCTLVTDGGYSGKENTAIAQAHNIRLITTNLTGKKNKDYQEFRKQEEFKQYSNYRNGVETIPSILRRKYHVDTMPVRGKLRTGFFFGFKIGAINTRKLCNYLQGLNCYAQRRKLIRA